MWNAGNNSKVAQNTVNEIFVNGIFVSRPACHGSIFTRKINEGNHLFGENMKYILWHRAKYTC